jgi:hypothetical protein
MMENEIEILLVEDNPNDIKLALHAFKTSNLGNHVYVVRDGAEALEFVFGTGRYSGRNPSNNPGFSHAGNPCRGADVFQRAAGFGGKLSTRRQQLYCQACRF